jgi:hypothetical protein
LVGPFELDCGAGCLRVVFVPLRHCVKSLLYQFSINSFELSVLV